METGNKSGIREIKISLDRDIFMRSLIGELAGVLEDIVGYDEASGYVSLVGQNLGQWINEMYRKELKAARLSRGQVAEVLVDLKARIGGNFRVVYEDNKKLIFENDVCPFGDRVLDRPSMCMMTSNVFGYIAADNLGYAKVSIEESIAGKDNICRVVLYLKPSAEAEAAGGREYAGTG